MTTKIKTISEVAPIFGVTRFAVRGWIKSGKISAVWTSPHRLGIYQSEIDRFIKQYDLVVQQPCTNCEKCHCKSLGE